MKNHFIPFQKVLIRADEGCPWKPDIFVCYEPKSTFPYRCIGGTGYECIPYDKNQSLANQVCAAPDLDKTSLINRVPEGERYFRIDIRILGCIESGTITDKGRFEDGNYFETEAEARAFAEEIKSKMSMRHYEF